MYKGGPGKLKNSTGCARFFDYSVHERERSRFLEKVIGAATKILLAEGLRQFLPLCVAPAKLDNDNLYFLHLTTSQEHVEDGAFHFAVPRFGLLNEDELANSIAAALRTYAMHRETLFAQVADIRRKLSPWFNHTAMELHEIAIVYDETHCGPLFSIEFSMLEFNLEHSRSRRTASDFNSLMQSLQRAQLLHVKRAENLAERVRLKCDLLVQQGAKLLLDYCDLKVEDIVDALSGRDWVELELARDKSPLSDGSFWLEDGILKAKLRDINGAWALDKETFCLPGNIPIPLTAQYAWMGEPLCRFVQTTTPLDQFLIKEFKEGFNGITYVELELANLPYNLQ